MRATYTATILVSSALLFLVQPMFARMVLPLLGGSPAVWNTALVFYQVALLAGYGYVHWTTSRLGGRTQIVLHVGLLLAAGLCLPIEVPRDWAPPVGHNPAPALLGMMAVSLGLPFLVVSTTGPLLQKWFATTRHRLAPDPYFLYAASNLGSMVGLLSYPAVLEPGLGLTVQSRLWGIGYGLLVALTLVCAWLMRRSAGRGPEGGPPAPATDPPAPLTVRRRLRWVLLAFAPSSLMMGVTTHITTDIAAVPLLWVIPLGLYLLSFTLVFARRPLVPHALAVRVLPLLVLPLLVVMVGRPAQPILFLMGLHLALLFGAAMVCHGELARDRPPPAFLTEFYLWLAVGGALGGVFNALIAPIAFDSILEYPLAIALVCVLAPSRSTGTSGRRERVLDFSLPVMVMAVVISATLYLEASDSEFSRLALVLLVAVLTLPILSFSRRPLRFGLAVGAVLLASPASLLQRVRGLHEERTFFGVHRVQMDPTGTMHLLHNGSTLHGTQRIRPPGCREPLGYYTRGGPLGDVFTAIVAARPAASIAVAGLGAGGIAAYAEPGQRWTYFEIDPAVERIARDPSFFCFLEAAPPVRVVLGDARLSLAASTETFDLMILDAYSSDAIPVHLLTREAVRLYLDHLAERGVLVFHISNQYFELAPVVARLAADLGLTCRVRDGTVGEAAFAAGDLPSQYAVVARRPVDLGALASDPGWKTPQESRAAPWTDDFSSLFAALRRD